MHFTFSLMTKATPDQVFDAFTDFSPRRLSVWKQTLQADKYEVRELGDRWAVAKEGSPGAWVLVRYEWPQAGQIHWSVLDSNYCRSGTGDITIVPIDGNRTRLDADFNHRDGKGLKGNTALLLQRALGPFFFPRLWKAALDRLAAEPATR